MLCATGLSLFKSFDFTDDVWSQSATVHVYNKDISTQLRLSATLEMNNSEKPKRNETT